ncbi:MAG: guanylate kinase, partial [Pseudomonadales bacterium]|nr:guanylate kinase [Pseudomonadales bacterium]
DRMQEFRVAVSHTTRKKRSDEVDGVNYHFIDEPTFIAMEGAGAFVESARIFGNLYGTSREEVDRILASGHHMILEIDWQGADQIRRNLEQVTSIFILPPSLDTLKARLVKRGQDDMATITRRLAEAITEISHYRDFDFLVVNDDFDETVDNLQRIILEAPLDLSTAVQIEEQSGLLADLLSGKAG